VRIPGYDGSTIRFTAVADPDGVAAEQQAMGVTLTLANPHTQQTFDRLPVNPEFPARLAAFLKQSAAHTGSPSDVPAFEDENAGIKIMVQDSTDFTATLVLTLTREPTAGDPRVTVDWVVPTGRSSLLTAAEEVPSFADRRQAVNFSLRRPQVGVPFDLLRVPGQRRLTGVYDSGIGLVGDDDIVLISHHVRLTRDAQGDLETSLIASHLPFCEIAIHGVDEDRHPWALLTQLLPMNTQTDIAAPWDPIIVAREELIAALKHAGTDEILGEVVATRDHLINEITNKGVPADNIDSWEVSDLARACIADIANIPLPDLVAGHLTRCAYPNLEHDCPGDVFACAFDQWQQLRFNPPEPRG
jgi:hypothetical protein